MPIERKISAAEYYETLPSAGFRAGDIWQDLPTFGHLRRERSRGIVITPACDLANRKAETVSYLPIVSIKDYITGPGLAPVIVRTMRGQAQAAGIDADDLGEIRGFNLPTSDRILDIKHRANEIVSMRGMSSIRKLAAERTSVGATLLYYIRNGGESPRMGEVRKLFGDSLFKKSIEEIIKNSYSTDVHFLPCDGKTGLLSSMESHSVVLFRYPLSLPFEVLDVADDISQKDWRSAVVSLEITYPIARHIGEHRPLRVTSLKARFFSDLLARFSALHIRMGSPDFTTETVSIYYNEIGMNV